MPSTSSIPHKWIASVLIKELRNELKIDPSSADESSDYSDANSGFGALTQPPPASQRYRYDGSNSRFKHIPDLPQTNVQVIRFEDSQHALQAVLSDGSSEIVARFTQTAVDRHPGDRVGAFATKTRAILALRKFEIVIDHCLADDSRRIQLLVANFKCLQTLPNIIGQPTNVIQQPHVRDLCQKLLDQRKNDKGNRPVLHTSDPEVSAEAAQLLNMLKPIHQRQAGSSPAVSPQERVETPTQTHHIDTRTSSAPPAPPLVPVKTPAVNIRWGEIFEDIPEDQADLLKRPNSWYKPSPGQGFPAANVPTGFLALFRDSLTATEKLKHVTEHHDTLMDTILVAIPTQGSMRENAVAEDEEAPFPTALWPASQDPDAASAHDPPLETIQKLPSSSVGAMQSVAGSQRSIGNSPQSQSTTVTRPGQIYARSLSPDGSTSSSSSASSSPVNSVDMHTALQSSPVKGAGRSRQYNRDSLPPDSSNASPRSQTPIVTDSAACDPAPDGSRDHEENTVPGLVAATVPKMGEDLGIGMRANEAKSLGHDTDDGAHPVLNFGTDAQLTNNESHNSYDRMMPESGTGKCTDASSEELKRKRPETSVSPSKSQTKKFKLVPSQPEKYLTFVMQEQKRSRKAHLVSETPTKDVPKAKVGQVHPETMDMDNRLSIKDRSPTSHMRQNTAAVSQNTMEADTEEDAVDGTHADTGRRLLSQSQSLGNAGDEEDPRPPWFTSQRPSQATLSPVLGEGNGYPRVDSRRQQLVATSPISGKPTAVPSSTTKSRRSLPWAASQPDARVSWTSIPGVVSRPVATSTASSMPSFASLNRETKITPPQLAVKPIKSTEIMLPSNASVINRGNRASRHQVEPTVESEPLVPQTNQVTSANQEQAWYKDNDTPFKHFARNMAKLRCFQVADEGSILSGILTKMDGGNDASQGLTMDVLRWRF